MTALPRDQLFEREIRYGLAKPLVLLRQLLEPLRLVRLQAAISLRHRQKVNFVTPIDRTTSATDWPCETNASTCRSFTMILSGLGNLLAIGFLRFPKHSEGPLQWRRINLARHELWWYLASPTRTNEQQWNVFF